VRGVRVEVPAFHRGCFHSQIARVVLLMQFSHGIRICIFVSLGLNPSACSVQTYEYKSCIQRNFNLRNAEEQETFVNCLVCIQITRYPVYKRLE
jgi:hypothetical protein